MKKIMLFLSCLAATPFAFGMNKFKVVKLDENQTKLFSGTTFYEEDDRRSIEKQLINHRILLLQVATDKDKLNQIMVASVLKIPLGPEESYSLIYDIKEGSELRFNGSQYDQVKSTASFEQPSETIKGLLRDTLNDFLKWQTEENKEK